MRKLAHRFAYLAAAGTTVLTAGCLSESIERPPLSEAMSLPDRPVRPMQPVLEVASDHFDELAAIYLAPPPRPIRQSLSLGFIGDEPLGRFDPPKRSILVEPASEGRASTECSCPRACRRPGSF